MLQQALHFQTFNVAQTSVFIEPRKEKLKKGHAVSSASRLTFRYFMTKRFRLWYVLCTASCIFTGKNLKEDICEKKSTKKLTHMCHF